jgi:PAS domain S-box-containing protein
MSLPSKNSKKKIQAEEEILGLESYIKDFWQFLPLPVCYINPFNIILNIDEIFSKFSGYQPSEIIGEDLGKLFSDSEKAEEFKKEILEKETVSSRELVFITKDKKEIPVSISAMQRKDEKGNFIGYFFSLVDISESKKFQERLEKEIEKKTEDLKEKIGELERMNKIMTGRELKMVELKEKIKQLEKQLKNQG